MDYQSAGVDREGAANWIKSLSHVIKSTQREEVLSGVGGYAALFESPSHYKNPVWVAGTDGVGTKLLLAEEAGDQAFYGIGFDLVAMCVNDLLACAAEPLVFLDYMATGKLNLERSTQLLTGIAEACREAGASLIGGETAEMPGFYKADQLDVAGFSIGVLDKSQLMSKDNVKVGDIVMALPSSGFHSNGYSLIRKVMEQQGWDLSTEIEGRPLGTYLLEPTRIYTMAALSIVRKPEVSAAAHITGGGFFENLPRVFDESKFEVEIDSSAWTVPEVMQTFVSAAEIDKKEAYSTWNMGIGFCVFCRESLVEKLEGLSWMRIGQVKEKSSEESVVLR